MLENKYVELQEIEESINIKKKKKKSIERTLDNKANINLFLRQILPPT
jgi:hypothetical protein